MLRPYQQNALDAILADFRLPGASLVVMPTASGKSHVIASAAQAAKTSVLILQPSRELLAQNYAKLALLVPEADIGIYSASFGRKEVRRFTFATIQSVYTKAELFKGFQLVIMDEAHNLAPKSLDTMYMQFFKEMNSPKVIGLTATPYRLELGYHRDDFGDLMASTMLKLINRSRHKDAKEMFWKRIVYTISHAELLAAGYLVPLEYVDKPLMPYEEIPVNKSCSDYNLEGYAQSIVGHEAEVLATLAEAQRRYKSVLVFCATTDQARRLQRTLVGSELVLAETKDADRERIIADFKGGKVKTVFNVGTLTTGFDHPALDCIVLLRPTRSLPLYNQMLGRLTRLAEGKTHGTVIDLTGTCKRLGRIESFELYLGPRGLWNLRTEKREACHDLILFSFKLQGR